MVRVLATLFSALLLLIVAIVVAGSVIVYRYGKDLPDIRQLATYEPAVTSGVLGRWSATGGVCRRKTGVRANQAPSRLAWPKRSYRRKTRSSTSIAASIRPA